MKEKNIMRSLPYIIGAILLLIGGIRFFVQNDYIGATIGGVAATLALLWAFFQNKERRRDTKD